MPLAPGSRLGPYEIVAPLGAGGMGEVYRARDPRLGRDVAIKIVPEALAGTVPAMGRFERGYATVPHFPLGTTQIVPFGQPAAAPADFGTGHAGVRTGDSAFARHSGRLAV